MAIFALKGKKKYNLSRIPHGDLTVGSYIIRPYTTNLKKLLDGHLKELLSTDPSCLDSQNGNVLDAIIDQWKSRAIEGIKMQRADHLERIRDLSASIQSNAKNAQDWLEIDEAELQKLKDELESLEEAKNADADEMRYW